MAYEACPSKEWLVQDGISDSVLKNNMEVRSLTKSVGKSNCEFMFRL